MQSEAVSAALFFANGLGDHILNLPAIRAAREEFGDGLRLVCMQGVAPVFFGEFDDLRWLEIDWESSEGSGLEFDVDPVVEFCAEVSLFLNLNPWISDSTREVIGRLPRAKTIGLHAGHDVVLPLDYTKHTSDLAFDVVRAAGVSSSLQDHLGPPQLDGACRLSAGKILAAAGEGRRVLAIHGDTGQSKMLREETWIEVVNGFLGRHPEFLVYLVGARPLDFEQGPHSDRVIPCYGLELGVSMALAGQADLFAGVDSCLLHSADFHRVPSLGVFVSTDPNEFGCLVGEHRHVLEPDLGAPDLSERMLDALEDLLADSLMDGAAPPVSAAGSAVVRHASMEANS